MAKSTSFHQLNGDIPLNHFQRLLYFVFNWLNNSFPNLGVDSSMKCKKFQVQDLNNYWERCELISSPSRKLSDIFWMSLLWEELRRELKNIIIFDTGCGSGNYSKKLVEWSGDRIASYTGVDLNVHNNWSILMKENPIYDFHKSDSKMIKPYIKAGTNFIMSQSAIEHFREDLTFFKIIRDHIVKSHAPTVQFHLFPSSINLKLYGNHGFRQYTPRTIQKIWTIFKNFSSGILFELGGEECNRLHWNFITKPILLKRGDLREQKTVEYDRKLKDAILNDSVSDKSQPSFYALCIYSNMDSLNI